MVPNSVFYASHLATIGKNTGSLITDQGTKFTLYYNKISGYDIYYCILNYLWNIYIFLFCGSFDL